MLDTLLWVAVGAFVGWNLPQPALARYVQNKVVGLFRRIGGSNKS